MSGLFSSSQNTHTSSTNDSTGNTQGNLATNPQYQEFLRGYGANAVDAMGNITSPTNPWGTQAADNQSGVVNNINPALSAASNAASGTTYNADSYKPFMSPYTQDVTNAIRDQYKTTMGQVAEQARGNLASQGALGNSNNPVAITNALTPVANAENTAIANVIQQGFNQANQNAQEAGRFQLQGATTLGSTIGAATGANTGLANIGQGLFGQQMQAQEFPATLGNLFTQGWQGNNSILGYNTQNHSTGVSDSTTTKNPSLFSDILGTAGMIAGMFKDGGSVMEPYADGGAVIDLDPVLLAHLIKGMPPAYAGKFADGGDVQEEPRLGIPSYLAAQIADAQAGRGAWSPDNASESRLLETLGKAGNVGAELTMIPQAFRAKDAVIKAYDSPSIPTVTNAVLQTAIMGLPFNPVGTSKAMLGIMGAGNAAATAKELGLPEAFMPSPAHAQERFDPVKEALSDKEIADYQRLKRRAANGDKDVLPVLDGYQKRIDKVIDAYSARQGKEAEIKAASEAKLKDDAAAAERAATERRDAARKEILGQASAAYNAASKDRRFSDTEWGKLYDETGGAAPFMMSAAGGALGGMARHPAWAAAGEGALLGVAGTSLPFLSDYVASPALNPKRQGMIAYNEIAPADDPRRQRYEELMKNEMDYPVNNPVPEAALQKLFDPRRIALSLAEGAGMGLSGWAVPKATPYAAKGVESALRGVGNLAKDAVTGTAEVIGSVPGAMATAYHKGMGRAATAKEAAAELQQNAASRSRLAADESRSAAAARADLEEALRRSNGPRVSTDQPTSPLPERSAASDRNSGPTSVTPSVAGNDTVPALPSRQEIMDELAAIRQGVEAQKVKELVGVPDPVKREALPVSRAPSYTNKYKSVAQPFITGRVNEGREVPTTSEVMGQFDKANMKQPSFKTVDERVSNADRLLALIQSKNPGITPQQAARKLGDYMANPKSIPSDWGLPKEFILPAVAAPIAASAISGNSREGHADGGYVSPDTHEIPEGHAWEHRGVGSKVRGPDGAFVPMGIAQRKNGGAAPKRAFSTGGAVTIGPVMGVTGGRTDAKPVNVPANSYVIPADVVSGLPQAEGNTVAGMHILQKHFGAPLKAAHGYASGGTPHKPVPILISDGEFVVTPEMVAKHGGGDVKQGHRVLDALVKKVRATNIQKLKSLPAPAR